MKLHNLNEIEDFKKAVSNCKNDVWLESPYGDKYNLKSVLSQYIALGTLLGEKGDELELFCASIEDEKNFYEFFNSHPDSI